MLIHTLDILGKRVTDAIDTYNMLMAQKRYYDAFAVAGHAFETTAILCYIKDCDEDDVKKLERHDKYIASSYHHILLKQFFEIWGKMPLQYVTLPANLQILGDFDDYGEKIIKKGKDHKQSIAQLKLRSVTNQEKQSILKNNYCPVKEQHYVDYFIKIMVKPNNKDKEWFQTFYANYCCHKHSNFNTILSHAFNMDSAYIREMEHIVKYIKSYIDSSKNEEGDWVRVFI